MKNLDALNNPDALIVWTVQEARELSPEHQVPAHETISRIVDSPSIELDTKNLTAGPTSEVVAGPKPNTILKVTQDAPSISPDVPEDRGRFSLSIFTIEVDGKPTLAFGAKKYSEAEAICRDEQLRTKLGSLKSGDFPPSGENSILDVRLANPDEAALYKQAAAGSQSTDGLLLVYLLELDSEGQ
jgi:hypothetical protein